MKSQLELLLEWVNVPTIGVTGTKGKSTTSTLIYQMLKEQNRKAMLLGNIGTPVFEHLEEIEKDMILVLEMSSHQLEFMNRSPHIAILLNAYEEHLDHYESFEKYVEAKCNIFKFQTESDYFFYNSDNEILQKIINKTKAQTYRVSLAGEEKSEIYRKNEKIYQQGKEIYDETNPRNLKGEYNLNNIMFVLGVSEILGLDLQKTIETIQNFKTLAHRLELVGTFDEITFYDNSIATVPKATIEAVKALEQVDTLIIGGMDRGIDYQEFVNYLNQSEINHIICMPKTRS